MLGAPVPIAKWWLWNQIPVTLGNIFAGVVFTAWAFYATYHTKPSPAAAESVLSPALVATPLASEPARLA
jgi:uncharacterized PurR-regulated membrane protein YhhQ (DUF165 family)